MALRTKLIYLSIPLSRDLYTMQLVWKRFSLVTKTDVEFVEFIGHFKCKVLFEESNSDWPLNVISSLWGHLIEKNNWDLHLWSILEPLFSD